MVNIYCQEGSDDYEHDSDNVVDDAREDAKNEET